MKSKKDSKGRNLYENEDQMEDGRYRFRYTDSYGNRASIYSWRLVKTDKTPQGKKDGVCLREKEAQVMQDVRYGLSTASSTLTVNDIVIKYLLTKGRLRNSTMENYQHIFKKNIENSIIGKRKIVDIKKSDIKVFYKYLYSERKFSCKTIQLYQNLLFPSFELAIDDDLIRKNPCKGCMKDYVRSSLSSDRVPLTRQEQSELLKFLQDDVIYNQYYPLISLMLATGCRIGEALGLTWDDISFDEKLLSINHQLIYKKKDGRFVHYISDTKTGETRLIPLKDDIIAILKRQREEKYFLSLSSGTVVDGYSKFVFINRESTPYTPNTVVRAFHGIREAYNRSDDKLIEMSDFSPHTLRHTFCTRMAENGMDIKVLQEVMGHKNIEVTMQVYNHVDKDRLNTEMARVESPLISAV